MLSNRLLIVSFFALFFGCGSGQAQQDQQANKGKAVLQVDRVGDTKGKSDPETAKIIRQFAANAAGIANADFIKLATTGTAPDPFGTENQALSLVIICHKVMDLPAEDYKDYHAEFGFSSSTPDASKLVKLLKPTDTVDCWTALHSKYITDVTCDVKNSTATGVISFDAELYAGHVHYSAIKKDTGWQINEFSFPVRDWRFILGTDGNWQWHDHFGRRKKDRDLPKEKIIGQILHDDKPVRAGLKFFMKDYPEFYFVAETSPTGEFRVSLPAGEYIVTCDGQALKGKYNRRSTTDLVAKVEEGQTELTLYTKSTPQD